MDYKEFIKLANERFGLDICIEKEKASHLMCYERGNRNVCYDVSGPDAGYNNSVHHYSITINGWCYVYYHQDWKLIRDGVMGWRHGDNPHPTIPLENIEMF